MNKLRTIAIHLPQFHPIPENDEWWGKGFTEWTNVTKGTSRFKGHYQPHLPADLGFYDLRLEEARLAQESLAKEYGIYGFCYYHYWFNGKRILHEPVDRKLKNPKEDLPFMLCWANENWTRAWDGGEKEILLQQSYSEADDLAHIQALIPYFNDPRYIKIDNKPIFCIYRSTLLPDAKNTTDLWRTEAKKYGIDLYLVRFETFNKFGLSFNMQGGFDASVEFQPFGENFLNFSGVASHKDTLAKNKISLLDRLKIHYSRLTGKDNRLQNLIKKKCAWDYNSYVEFVCNQPQKKYKQFPGITPGWDNSARRKKNAFLFYNSNPTAFKKWLYHINNNFLSFSKEENFIFINAWNEWAEGNHLEPCQKWGLEYLQAIKEVLNG